jgi:hypothetical protein
MNRRDFFRFAQWATLAFLFFVNANVLADGLMGRRPVTASPIVAGVWLIISGVALVGMVYKEPPK